MPWGMEGDKDDAFVRCVYKERIFMDVRLFSELNMTPITTVHHSNHQHMQVAMKHRTLSWIRGPPLSLLILSGEVLPGASQAALGRRWWEGAGQQRRDPKWWSQKPRRKLLYC